MWNLKLVEWRTNKEHSFKIKTCGSIQWRASNGVLTIEDRWSGKKLRTINTSKFGPCSIICNEVL